MTHVSIEVKLPSASYAIHIESGSLARVGEHARRIAPADRLLLVADAAIARSHTPIAEQSLAAAGFDVHRIDCVAEERRKTLDSVRQLYDKMRAVKLDRSSPVVALGGGIIGDLAGFAAATYVRGLPLILVPTTLLAMVDASIGGKTGVNLELFDSPPTSRHGQRSLAKNMVGSFHQPRAVLIDPQVLRTLETRHVRCGLAECVKHGMIADGEFLTFLAGNADRIEALELDVVSELIARSARIKVEIVQRDEREAGDRAILNLGHTFAHAIESVPSLDVHHGEAVAIGLVAAMSCSVQTGRMATDQAMKIGNLLTRLGLPTRLPARVSMTQMLQAMEHDKKAARGRLRLILPLSQGGADIVGDLPDKVIREAWHAVGAVSEV